MSRPPGAPAAPAPVRAQLRGPRRCACRKRPAGGQASGGHHCSPAARPRRWSPLLLGLCARGSSLAPAWTCPLGPPSATPGARGPLHGPLPPMRGLPGPEGDSQAGPASDCTCPGGDPWALLHIPNPSPRGTPSFAPRWQGQGGLLKGTRLLPANPPPPPRLIIQVPGWLAPAALLRHLPRAPGPGFPFSQINSTLRRNEKSARERRCFIMRFSPASLGIRHLAEWHTWLIRFNYVSFKFKNPLKERTALAAGRCLPTHRGNHGLLCLNCVTLPWAVAPREPGFQEGAGSGPPALKSTGQLHSVQRRKRAPCSVLASDL
ncbi:basic proline-rich protein-like [Acinonyx jubatus]|uniref:Basic proline-rich protein-like n=1 Tax=Acinonyx jubatus TaxID=32536 RepID=A0ABM3NUC9_ACIJB|nr:basic proline-rich protein-like [Acinonyx jubatus]XP_053063037.1 basic proline-rich protein-like [Acinonyx jubatus]